MPRNGQGVYAPPANTKGVTDTTISSAAYNAYIDDLTADANNARPISAGGTGGTNATEARTNLGVAGSGVNTNITGVTLDNTGLKVKGLTGLNTLTIKPGTTYTAARTLTVATGDADRTLTLAGNFSTAGAFAQTLTATAATTVTLPTTGTLATLAGTETLTNKTLTSPNTNGAILVNATYTVTIPAATDTLVNLTSLQTLTNKTLSAPVFSGTSTGTITHSGVATITAGGTCLFLNRTANDVSQLGFQTAGSNRGYIGANSTYHFYVQHGNGSVYLYQDGSAGNLISIGNVTAFSDARVKKDVRTIEDALDKVNRMRGVHYTRTDLPEEVKGVGVIAQEMRDVVPEVVNEGEGGILNVAYGNLVGVLIEAIKQLTARVEELEAR